MMRQKGQNVPLRDADKPLRQPARERSWQGNDAQARSAGFGRSVALIFAMSSHTKWSRPKFAVYTASL